MSVVLVVLFLLFMKRITITTSLGLDFVLRHEISRGLGGGDSNVSTAAKKYYQCLDKEREALLLFKAGIINDAGLLSSWSSHDHECCKWFGVICSTITGHVIELHLQGQLLDSYLTGKITSALLELHHLSYIDLSFNDFSTQPIPKFIGSLAKLKYLDLSYCRFSGIVPSQLGNLSNLNYLAIQEFYSLETNLEWLPQLTSLRHLNMDGIDLSKAIHWSNIINSLPFLSHVSFAECQLPSVTNYPSPSLMINSSTSSSIIDLDLSSNNLTSTIFHWLFNLSTGLVNLTLSSNQLNGPIPRNFGKFTSLVLLDLSNNQLEGQMPKSFRNLCSLQTLDLSNNNISGNLADSLHNMQSGCAVVLLEKLDVSENKVTGSLPDGILRFSTLKNLDLSANRLNGGVSENLGKLSKLESLDLSANSLHGTLTEAHLLNLPNLVYLNLSSNSLALVVSSNWVPSFQLVHLSMNSCKPGPSSLEWIQTQQNLESIDFANCGISAIIPMSFWDRHTSLEYLNLSSNQIRGKVPNFPSNFNARAYRIATIDLRSNLFEGPIPTFPSSLTALDLSKNRLSGSLSLPCQNTEKLLTFLDLSHNFLTGGLPDCLMQFTELLVLNLASNNFSLNIPTSIGSLFQLQTLNLYDNNFFGELPLSLRNCTSLSFLDLGANKLSGNVPAWIGEDLQLLYALSLRSNNFIGVIPLHLCRLKYLQILDLSKNSFFGSIPPCLNNLTAMVNASSSIEVGNHVYDTYYTLGYFDNALVEWQGRETEFGKNLGLLKIIDLSSNQLTGKVPNGITTLEGLVVLNLSRNKLLGKIPEEIGQLKSLQSLNLSGNEFSGRIPQGMALLSFLSNLDLSHNNLSGRIPSGRQLETLDPSAFAENSGLCGPPLTQKCPGDEPPPIVPDGDDYQEDNNDFLKWLYIGMSTGFITGFWGVCGALLLNHRCRHAFSRFFDSLKDSL